MAMKQSHISTVWNDNSKSIIGLKRCVDRERPGMTRPYGNDRVLILVRDCDSGCCSARSLRDHDVVDGQIVCREKGRVLQDASNSWSSPHLSPRVIRFTFI